MADSVVNRGGEEKKKKKRRPRKKVRPDEADSSSDSSDELDFFVGGPLSATAGRKARELADRASQASAAQRAESYMEKVIADPLSQIIDAVKKLGDFSDGEIRAAISRMFDEGLRYDNPKDVVDFIKNGPPVPPVVQDRAPSKGALASTASASTAAAALSGESIQPAPLHLSTISRPGANDQSGVHSLPMASKLEIAASHPDLQTAVTALCSWASVVGAPKASKQFFLGKAPELLILSILNTPTSVFQSKAVQDSLASLFEYIFYVSGGDDALSKAGGVGASLLKSLISVSLSIETAKNAGLLVAGSSAAITRMADGIAAGLRALSGVLAEVNESVLSSNRGDGKVVENAKSALSSIDESISKLSLSAQKSLPIVGSDAGSFKNLFGIRDARFEILELQKQALKQLDNIQIEPEPVVVSNMISDKLLSNAAKVFQQVHIANKEAVDKLITEIKLLPKPESSVFLSPISKAVANDRNNLLKSRTSELSMCEENLSNMLRMKASLEAELEALAKDIASASSRRDSLRAEVSRLVASPSPAPAAPVAAPHHALATPEFDSRIISDKLTAFADCLSSVGNAVVTSLLSQHGKSDSSFSATNSIILSSSSGEERRTLSFRAFESYAESEASCLEALANRIVLLRGRIQLKQRELAEYKKIGVSGILNDLAGELMQLERNLSEDMETLKALQTCLADNLQGLWSPKDSIDGKWSHTRAVIDRARLLLAASGLPVHPLVAEFASPSNKSTTESSAASSASSLVTHRSAGARAAPAAAKFAWKKVDPPVISQLLKSDAAEAPERTAAIADESTLNPSDFPVVVSPAPTPTQGARSFKQISPNRTPREKSRSNEQSTPTRTPVKSKLPSPSSKAVGTTSTAEMISPKGRKVEEVPAVVVTGTAATQDLPSSSLQRVNEEDTNSPLPKRTPRQAKKAP